jgi:hypothetical protein
METAVQQTKNSYAMENVIGGGVDGVIRRLSEAAAMPVGRHVEAQLRLFFDSPHDL